MLDGSYFFECQCESDEHTLRFTLDKEYPEPEIYVSIFLDQYHTWYERVWVAIKYIFGYKCKYGHFNTWSMKPEDATKLRDMCNDFLIRRGKREG